MYKTDALKSLLLKINPYLDIRTDCVKVTEENLVELLGDEPIICEAFDRPEAKAMLVNGVLEQASDEKLLSVRGWRDRTGVWQRSDGTSRGDLCGT